MKSPLIKIISSIVITAIVSVGGTYYFSEPRNSFSKKNNLVLNQSSKEYAVMGGQVWSAFQCYSWASEINDQEEAARLFMFGYEQGKKFIGALNAQRIKPEDLSSEVPIAVTMLLQGPSEEFILGRIHENAQENALKDVFKTGTEYNSEETQATIAENKFREGNCQLIGR